ncbi:hypothetical protein DRQ09_03385 [candidate division KSB1 bacterium]|nr:MAG: hypothetical protein DRQ09_03385 [candidate division KSB1 bacterium]
MLRKIVLLLFPLYVFGVNIYAQIKYVNILAIRVEFIEDNIETTNGNGKFNLSDTSSATIDPPPHNKLYFEDHLEALKRYFYKVSGGKVIIGYDVFPDGLNDSYQLPHQMNYYNPNTTEEELDMRLSELLRDAFRIFDEKENIDYKKYNSFIVFHAGVGSDFLLVSHPSLDPTPNDLPSVYLDFEHLKKTIGKNIPDFKGIPVGGNSFYIRNGLIFPETESKMGIELALNGIIAHQFAHQLGLPSLFNTGNGKPAIGKWGLMDVGFGNFNGLIPPKPCAWSRVFLGWEKPVEINEGENLEISSSEVDGFPTIYKIPISPDEYFLVENRENDRNKDSLKTVYSPRGVLLEVDNYDWDIPGSGILIWHIDERIIKNKIENNKINEDMKNRGVDLEEADGSEDIGENFEFVLPGFFTPENGVEEDAFYKGNNEEFTPYTFPNSNSNSGALSHIYISNISEKGSVMSFSLRKDFYVKGFPVFIGKNVRFNNPVWSRDFQVSNLKTFTLGSKGILCALDKDGKSFINSYKKEFIIKINGDTLWNDIPYFSNVGDGAPFSPILFREGDLQIAIVTDKGEIVSWNLEDNNMDGVGDISFMKNIGENINSEPVYWNGIIIGDVSGNIYCLKKNGELRWKTNVFSSPVKGFAVYKDSKMERLFSISENGDAVLLEDDGNIQWWKNLDVNNPFNPSIGDITGDNIPEIIVCDSSGNIVFLKGNGDILAEKHIPGKYEFISPPSIGDLDNDGFSEVVVCGKKYIYAFSYSGNLKDGFPVSFDRTGKKGNITTIPVLCDMDGDRFVEILISSDKGDVYAFNYKGEVLSGFPLTCGSGVSSSVVILENLENGNLQLMLKSYNGYLFLWEFPIKYESTKIPWGEYLHDSRHTSLTSVLNKTPIQPGGELMPKNRVYNYPNPVYGNTTTIRYYLNFSADVNIYIYDLAGELVKKMKGTGIPRTDNEVIWDVTDVQSGVYLAKITASGSAKKSSAIIKIAVSK